MTSQRNDVEAQLVSLLERLEEREAGANLHSQKTTMIAEVRSLDLWRSVIAECLASVFFVFLVCGSYSPWLGKSGDPDARIVVALVTGLSMAVLIHSFGQISGGHLNPAVTLGLAVARRISPLRASMYIMAQLGGSIAGAALLFGATSSGYGGSLGITEVTNITLWQAFGVEFLLTLIIVFVFFSSPIQKRRDSGSSPMVIGLTYLACSLVGFPLTRASMNPARSLGPAFVMNKWTDHWIYWVSPLLGGITAALIYEYIFNLQRISLSRKDSMDGDSSSIASEEDAYDECSKAPPRYNYNSLRPQSYDQYRPANTSTASPLGYNASIYGQNGTSSVYSAPSYKYENYGNGKEDIYSGSKSLYAKSPPPSRSTNLNRSQSVYTRPNPPRSDTYYRNINGSAKSPGSFTGLLQDKNRQEGLYLTNKNVVKPEPVYGVPAYNKDDTYSKDSSYSTYRSGHSRSNPTPAARTRLETPSSVSNSGFTTPISISNYHSPNPQY